jgi:hypothetical protein
MAFILISDSRARAESFLIRPPTQLSVRPRGHRRSYRPGRIWRTDLRAYFACCRRGLISRLSALAPKRWKPGHAILLVGLHERIPTATR